MTHTYLTEKAIKEAIEKRGITKKEAKKLMKKVDCQVFISKTTQNS